MIIWLASYPRSGNRFAKRTLNVRYGARGYSIYSKINLRQTSFFTKGCDLSKGLPDSEQPLASGEFAVVKTHELPDPRDRVPALYVLRDGRDAYVSYAHFSMGKHPEKYAGMDYLGVLELLIKSTRHFGGWSAHVEAWTTRHAPTAVIRYEDMLAEPASAVARACASLGLELVSFPTPLPTFEEQQAENPAYARKGKAGSWQEEMPPHLESLFWAIHGPWMERLGYSR